MRSPAFAAESLTPAGMSGRIAGKLSIATSKASANSGKLSGRDAWERGVDWLRVRHPQKFAEHVAATTSGAVSADTARKWLHGSAPSFFAMVALVAAYGPEFLAACYGDARPAWLDAVCAEEVALRHAAEIRERRDRR